MLEDVKDNAEIKSTLEDKADVKNVSAGAEEIKSTSKDKAVVNSMPEAKFLIMKNYRQKRYLMIK